MKDLQQEKDVIIFAFLITLLKPRGEGGRTEVATDSYVRRNKGLDYGSGREDVEKGLC